MMRIFTLTILAMAALATPSRAQTLASLETQNPILRAQATVSGEFVRIGDLIDHAGIVANIPIFRAPDLGMTGTVSVAQVVDAVRPHAIVGLNTDGLSEVVVTRASRTIPIADIQTEIATSLAAQYALGAPKDIQINFEQAIRSIQVEAASRGAPRLAKLGYSARSGRFDVTVDIPGNAPLRFTGTAIPTAEILTLAHPVGRGELIKAADVVRERRARADINADMLTELDQVAGLAARNALTTGRPIRSADLTKPDMVRRNENVTLVYEAPGITLTLRGKASDSGAEGDAIDVLNVQTKRIVQGVITGPGRVVVTAPTPHVVAEAEATPPASSRAPARAQ
jgi:flagella basal body P-ring formation protein FlgA